MLTTMIQRYLLVLHCCLTGNSTWAFFAPLRPRRWSATSVLRQGQRTKNVAVQQSSKPNDTLSSAENTPLVVDVTDSQSYVQQQAGHVYLQFAKDFPFLTNVMLASGKTAAADLAAQSLIGGAGITEIDLSRTLLFFLFGGLYSGAFQYLYQVQIFQRLFDIDDFTQKSWAEKIKDKDGLQALLAQTALDLGVLTLAYLPCFYIFKAALFDGSMDPLDWFSNGVGKYQANFAKDEFDVLRVWLPADLVCFSVPLYLRMPVRHVVSFAWTAYLSLARGGH